MKKGKSVNRKIAAIVAAMLLVTFVVLDIAVGKIIRAEVLNQWKTDGFKLVQVYSELMQANGCETTEEYQQFIDDINQKNTFNYALYIEEVDGEVTAVAHSNPQRIGIVLDDAGSIAAARDGETFVGYFTDPVSGGLTLDVLNPIFDASGNLLGALNIGIPIDTATMNHILQSSLLKVTIICILFAFALLVLLCICLYRILIRPLKVLSHNIEKMADYDFSIQDMELLSYEKRQDEIGTISRSFFAMKGSLTELVFSIEQVVHKLSSESENLSEACSQVFESGNQLTTTVNEVAQGATTQAQQTTQGNREIEYLSSLIERVEQNMESLDEATIKVEQIKVEGLATLEKLVKTTDVNNEKSTQVHEVVQETSRQADRIKEASSKIREIASQTNLLALNASIESARAGEAGRGFAVVATEIGNLAGETNQLTTQIEEIIHELIHKMTEAVSVIEGMELSLEAQTKGVEETTGKFNAIAQTLQYMEEECKKLAVSTGTMKQSKKSIVDMVSNLSALSQQNAACMEEAAASVEMQTQTVEKVSDSSRDVAQLAENLKEEIHKFTLDDTGSMDKG